MRSPNIALSATLSDDGCVSVNEGYLKSVFECGGIPALLYPCVDKEYIKRVIERFDGFLFCGGGDIDPRYYGERKDQSVKNICSLRDEFECLLFDSVYKSGKPIMGICRGMQIINVFLGGSLHRHIDGHMQIEDKKTRTHYVYFQDESILSNITSLNRVKVNSFHHQAVMSLADVLSIDALSDDGYIEAFHQKGHKFLLCVQWHPEACYDDDQSSRMLFEAFLGACER